MNSLTWVIRSLSGILLLIPMVLEIPGNLLYVLAEELETYQDMQERMKLEMQNLKKEKDGEEIIL